MGLEARVIFREKQNLIKQDLDGPTRVVWFSIGSMSDITQIKA